MFVVRTKKLQESRTNRYTQVKVVLNSDTHCCMDQRERERV